VSGIESALVLELVKEYKVYELLPGGSANDRLEASGVCVRNDFYYVIFDNSPHIARLHNSLTPGHPSNALLRQRGESAGFEDITYHPGLKRYLIILEALVFDASSYKPNIEEYDDDFRYLESRWVDFALEGANKGMEGLTYMIRNQEEYVLGVCEGNKCKSGNKGRIPGGGRIQILRRGETQWDYLGKLKLPKSVLFEDYASLEADRDRIAVVSQMSSALWVGQLQPNGWEWVDDGKIYLFPRNEAGEIIYCNIEGIAWVSPNQVVVVSDRFKPGEQSETCARKDQSIHIFNIPTG
jgi:hypothetical protein